MDAYLGIDIGTTNSKCLIATEEGIVSVASRPTPKKRIDGHLFFDIHGIEALVDAFIGSASDKYSVRSVGFSSIGESVVPVAAGCAVSDALMWDEKIPGVDESKAAVLAEKCSYSVAGTHDNGLFSVHKILWMQRNGMADGAEAFLPVSSYLAYRRTGKKLWDYSQAARSYMFSIRSRRWVDGLHEALGIPDDSAIMPMGSSAGEHDGIVYGLGGHDHIVGMYGIRRIFSHLFPGRSLYYSSMGTSEVMAASIKGEAALNRIINSENGCIIPSSNDEYIITRSFRMFGRFLSRIMDMLGIADFSALPERIRGNARCLFCCDGDYMMGNLGTGEINMLQMENGMKGSDVLEAAYIYLAAVSEILRSSIEHDAALGNDFIMAAGGGITDNHCFMQLLAAAFGSPVLVLDTPEISALGAMLTGLAALGEAEKADAVISSIDYHEIMPDSRLYGILEDAGRRYSSLSVKCLQNVK